jgi:hypothetical protein
MQEKISRKKTARVGNRLFLKRGFYLVGTARVDDENIVLKNGHK